MPDPKWQELYNAAILEFDLARLPERVEAACHAIHQYRVQKRQSLSAAERKELDDALRVLFTLMRRAARIVSAVFATILARRGAHGHNRAVEG